MRRTVCGVDLPDWLYAELVTRFGDDFTINNVFALLMEDYIRRNAPKTTCKDCGVETKPGAGSARCPECWEDRCG